MTVYVKQFTFPHYFTILAFVLTGLNVVSGLLGIYFSINGNLSIAFQFLLLGTLFDLLDGKVAKRAPTQTELGGYADSFADLVTFAVLPGYMVLGLSTNLWLGDISILTTPFTITLGQIFAGIYAIGGWYRLIRFSATQTDPSKFYGLPTAAAAMFIGAFTVAVVEFPDLPINIGLTLATVIIGFLMVSNISYPSPKRMYQSDNVLITAATIVSSLYLFFPNIISALLIIVISTIYIGGGPVYVQQTRQTPQT